MIDLGRLTALCSDCPQIAPIAGDLTMEGAKRHIYRQAYQAAESFGVKILDGLGNHDILPLGEDECSFDSIDHLRAGSSLSQKGWTVVHTWTTKMSADNECGHYCNVEDGHYYTIGITNRQMAPHNILAYVVQLHNAIYSETAVEYLNRAVSSMNRDRPIILVGHQFAGSALARFNTTVRDLKVNLF